MVLFRGKNKELNCVPICKKQVERVIRRKGIVKKWSNSSNYPSGDDSLRLANLLKKLVPEVGIEPT
jgi:hypothetical protein